MKKLLMTVLLAHPLIIGVNAADRPDISGDEEFAMMLALQELEGISIKESAKAPDDNNLYINQTDFEKFNAVSTELRKIYQNGGVNVHAGDSYIPGQIAPVLDIASKILTVCPSDINMVSVKSLVEQKDALKAIVTTYSSTLEGYKYEDTARSLANILSIIDSQFNRSAGEVGSYASGQGTRVWAFTLALAMNMLNDVDVQDEVKQTIVHHLVDQSIEGWLTQGGCIQGFINRGFIALMNMVSYYLPRQ